MQPLKKVSKLLSPMLRREALVVAFFVIVAMIIGFFLTTIPDNAALPEYLTVEQADSAKDILESPINAPYKIMTLITTTIDPSVRSVRAVSMVFFIITSWTLYFTLRRWHTAQTAGLTTLAFTTNSIWLAAGRLGTPLITVSGFFVLTGLLLWLLHSRSNRIVPIIVLICLATVLYTPGALWFLGILGVVYWKRFRSLLRYVRKKALIVGGLLACLVIAPLFYAFITDHATVSEWLLLPNSIAWGNVPRSILKIPSAFIYRMPHEPLLGVGRIPVLDIASGMLFLIGAYAYIQKLRLDRTRIIIGSGIMAIIAGALGQVQAGIILLLPFCYSIIAAGIEYLLDEWYDIFPRNPIARSFGVVIVSATVLFSSYYQLTRFFVVWPQTPDTRNTYNHSRIIP